MRLLSNEIGSGDLMTALKSRNVLAYLLIVQHGPDVAISKFNGIEGLFADWAFANGTDHAINVLEEAGEAPMTLLVIEQQ